jgi:Flp pilus assembly protein TadG
MFRFITRAPLLAGRIRADDRPGRNLMPRRARAQSMVEFGLIALLFVLLLFGIADFGMLLNGWINVSSAASVSARQASVGADLDSMFASVRQTAMVPGLGSCSAAGAPAPCVNALKMVAQYGTKNYCRGFKDSPYTSFTVTVAGTTLTCEGSAETVPPSSFTQGDTIKVTVYANTFQVATPLVRPFFGCSGSAPSCYVPLTSTAAVRYEGPTI